MHRVRPPPDHCGLSLAKTLRNYLSWGSEPGKAFLKQISQLVSWYAVSEDTFERKRSVSYSAVMLEGRTTAREPLTTRRRSRERLGGTLPALMSPQRLTWEVNMETRPIGECDAIDWIDAKKR